MTNLFGEDSPAPEMSIRKNTFAIKKHFAGYRTGYDDVRCKNCAHVIIKKFTHKIFKCSKFGDTASAASDIRAGAMCDFFKMKDNPHG